MTRTNIEIDDELIARVMRKFHLSTKREAVDFALRRVAGPAETEAFQEFLVGLRGSGWGGDINAIKDSHLDEKLGSA